MPFKILYSVYALKTCLIYQLQNVRLLLTILEIVELLKPRRVLQVRSSYAAGSNY